MGPRPGGPGAARPGHLHSPWGHREPGPVNTARPARRPGTQVRGGKPWGTERKSWEDMWEIEPAKRNEKHVSWCEGKRMQRPSVASRFPSSAAERGKGPSARPPESPAQLLRLRAAGSFSGRTAAQPVTVQNLLGRSLATSSCVLGGGKASLATDFPTF